MTVARTTQKALEVASQATPKLRATQAVLEVASQVNQKARVSQFVLEVASPYVPDPGPAGTSYVLVNIIT